MSNFEAQITGSRQALKSPTLPRCFTKMPKASGVALRLFCFPYAGAAAQIFHPWERALPKHIDLCPVQPPGRANRASERPHHDLGALVQELAAGISDWLDVPFVFLGHSLGALVAFELARSLRRRNAPQPQCLLVSGCRAPQSPIHGPVLHRLPEPDLIAELRKLGGTPEEVLEQPQLLRFILPPLRADLEVFETYGHQPERPLTCPIYGFAGADDQRAPAAGMQSWSVQTEQLYSLQVFPGGHFFLHQSETLFLESLRKRLASLY